MSLSLVIYDNPSPEEAYPLIATRDPEIITLVRRLLMARLGGEPMGKILALDHRDSPSPRKTRSHGTTD
jgi:hypothetical protein